MMLHTKGNNVELNNSKRFHLTLMLSLVLIFCTPGAHFSKGPVTFRVRRDVITL